MEREFMEHKFMQRKPESMRRFPVLLLLLTFACSDFAGAQAKPIDAEGHQWWQRAVFYEIYPRSFADSNGDGIGHQRSKLRSSNPRPQNLLRRTKIHHLPGVYRPWRVWREELPT